MIKLILILMLLLVSGCSNATGDKDHEPEKELKTEMETEDETKDQNAMEDVCVSAVFTEDKKCVISEFKKIRLDQLVTKAYDISTINVEANADEIIALAIDLTLKEFDDAMDEPRHGLDAWHRDMIRLTPYLYYEFDRFMGVMLEFKDDLGHHGSSISATIDSKWLVVDEISFRYGLAILENITEDTLQYKYGNYVFSRKGNVIKLLDVASD